MKKKYGKGYRALVKSAVENHTEVKKIVGEAFGEKHVTVENIGDNPENIIFTIKSKEFLYSKAFKLFETELKKSGMIHGYKINESTLEEIFLLLSEMQPEPEDYQIKEPWEFCCW